MGQQRGVENQKVWVWFQEQKKKKKVNWGEKKIQSVVRISAFLYLYAGLLRPLLLLSHDIGRARVKKSFVFFSLLRIQKPFQEAEGNHFGPLLTFPASPHF